MNIIELGEHPKTTALTVDNEYLFIANYRSSSVSIIDTEGDKIIKTIYPGSAPSGLDISPDDKYLYVSNWYSNDVTIVEIIYNESQPASFKQNSEVE